MDSDIMAILPWAAMLTLTIADITWHGTHVIQRHQPWRHSVVIIALLCLGVAWSLVIISAGPAPFAPRMAMLPYIRLGVLLGSVMLIGVNAVEALLAVRRYQARR
jgi:hypothetical protein